MVKSITTGLVLVISALPLASQAQSLNLTQPSYTHFTGGLTESSGSNRGFIINSEVEFAHKLYAVGTYRQIRQRHSDRPTFNESLVDVGVGRYFNIYDRSTFDLSATVGHFAQSSNVFDSDGSPFYTLNASLRQRYDSFEYRLGYRYMDMDEHDSEHGLTAAGYFYFTPQTALGIEFNDIYSRSTWSFALRFLF